jgi:hypothetical protein
MMEEALEKAVEQGIQHDMEADLPAAVELRDLDTLDKLEEFVHNPQNSGAVSFVAILMHLNRFRACPSPGTVLFLEDVQRMALGQLGAHSEFCAAVPGRHPALNARALLIALNFYQFDRLKMVPANIDENCSRWSGSPELVKRRNQVMHELHATGRGVLVRELARCRFAVENWFQSAPCPLETADITGTGVVAHDLDMLLQGNTTVGALNQPPLFQSNLEQTAWRHPGVATPPSSSTGSPSHRATDPATGQFGPLPSPVMREVGLPPMSWPANRSPSGSCRVQKRRCSVRGGESTMFTKIYQPRIDGSPELDNTPAVETVEKTLNASETHSPSC